MTSLDESADHAPPVPAGLHGVQHSSIELPTGRLEFVHPRDAMGLFREQNFGKGATEPPPYWAEPWPCGIELARAVAAERLPAGSRVLELGCGLGLPSLAAALGGADVLATDQAGDALAYVAYNARRNRVPLEVGTCRWADPAEAVADAAWDVVLAADVLYLHAGLAALAALLPRLVARSGEIWISDQARPPARDFLLACRRWATTTSVGTAHPDVTVHRLRPIRRAGNDSRSRALSR